MSHKAKVLFLSLSLAFALIGCVPGASQPITYKATPQELYTAVGEIIGEINSSGNGNITFTTTADSRPYSLLVTRISSPPSNVEVVFNLNGYPLSIPSAGLEGRLETSIQSSKNGDTQVSFLSNIPPVPRRIASGGPGAPSPNRRQFNIRVVMDRIIQQLDTRFTRL